MNECRPVDLVSLALCWMWRCMVYSAKYPAGISPLRRYVPAALGVAQHIGVLHAVARLGVETRARLPWPPHPCKCNHPGPAYPSARDAEGRSACSQSINNRARSSPILSRTSPNTGASLPFVPSRPFRLDIPSQPQVCAATSTSLSPFCLDCAYCSWPGRDHRWARDSTHSDRRHHPTARAAGVRNTYNLASAAARLPHRFTRPQSCFLQQRRRRLNRQECASGLV